MSESVVLGEIFKNSESKIVVSLEEYKGKNFGSVREHYYSEAENQWFPTKRGITIRESDWDNFYSVVTLLNNLIKKQAKENKNKE